jgi:hypothetical protein
VTRQPPPPHRRRPGWVGRVVVATAVVVVALGAPVPGLAPLTTPCASAADGTQRIAVAVDFGTVPGSPGGAATMCVTVPAGATGADALVERARILGRPAPRYAPSGLLCAIDGFPASGCGERVNGAYRYWAYFLSDGGSWTYASTGPALRRANPDRTEGWHYVAGAGTPVDPSPGLAASAQATCPPAPPVTTAPPPVPADPGAPGPGGSGPVSGPVSGPASGPATAGPAPAPASTPGAATVDGPATGATADPTGEPADDPADDPAGRPTPGGATATGDPASGTADQSGNGDAELAAAPGAGDDAAGGPWALVAAVAAMAALVGGSVVTVRRRKVHP